MRKTILIAFLFISFSSYSQPYLDIVKSGYYYSPESGFSDKTNQLKSNLISINFNLPIELKKGGDAFIINPFFDNSKGKIFGNDFHVISQGLLIGFLKKNLVPNWSLLSSFIVRDNKQAKKNPGDDWQYGGVILTTYKKNQLLSLKLGIYYNKEFFGNFFMPLAGIDWQINSKNNLFGVLPGSMVLEHKVNSWFYYGASFRALTNSYRLETIDPCFSGDCSAKNYLRIDDNQLGIFADTYLSKKIVLSAETGYTFFVDIVTVLKEKFLIIKRITKAIIFI